MSKDRPPPTMPFGDYLARAIRDAGFDKPTHFARKAGIDPSVVFRWISGEQRPTLSSLEKAAPVLGVPRDELVEAAYPGTSEPPEPRRDEGEELILGSDATAAQKKMMLERYRRRLETSRRDALDDVREQIELLRRREETG